MAPHAELLPRPVTVDMLAPFRIRVCSVAEREGVIKYSLEHRAGPPPDTAGLRRLDAWRTVLHRARLVGQSPSRYEGLGYGNVSLRADDGFVVSGTQTGGSERLGRRGYVLVELCDPLSNYVVSIGPVKPSSEALTHGAVYMLDSRIRCVLHVHSPEIWTRTAELELPATPADVRYGTPDMAEAVADLYADTELPERRVFAMAGHEDGIVAFGGSVDEAGKILMTTLADALAA